METYEATMEALGDPTRRALVERLRGGERSVNELAEGLPITRPAVSQHLAVLRKAGLVADRREGTRRIYRLEPTGFEGLRAWVQGFWDRALAGFVSAAETGEAGMEMTKIEPVRKTVEVRAPRERAFEAFADLGSWWPFEVHSIAVDDPEDGVEPALPIGGTIEPREGGRIIERWADGREFDWGSVLVWDPPSRLVLAWNPSRNPRPTTEIEVRFTEVSPGVTRVDLEHRGWERLGERADEARGSYDSGWPGVLGRYVATASA